MRLPKLLVLGEKVGRENDISKETCLRVFNCGGSDETTKTVSVGGEGRAGE